MADRVVSIRGRLGIAVALGAGLLAAVAAVSIAILGWQATSDTLADDVTLAAFVAADSDQPIDGVPATSGRDGFVVTFDDVGEVVEQTEELAPELLASLLDDVWSLATLEDDAVTVTYDGADGQGELSVAGLPCLGDADCDTVIVGAYREPLSTYLLSRFALIAIPVLVLAVVAGLAARWLVGRSLRPVDVMRRELAEITSSDLSARVEVPNTGDEVAQLGETFNDTIALLDAAVTANERFVADAAHELRSPLAGVRAAVELEGSKRPGGILDDTLVELDRAGRLVDDLLLLARRRGPGSVVVSDVDLDDLAAAEVRGATARFPEMELSAAIEPVRLQGDADALRRLVSNLVENACLYGESKVQVVVTSVEGNPLLEVHDDGPGIPSADTARIFERFARLDESRARATGGSGLGLSIVLEIATDSHATIEVADSFLGGACFRVEFQASSS